MSSKINCRFCNKPYTAYRSSRSHCSRSDCREKAIKESLDELCGYFSILLRYQIVADVEIRCPGNDTFGKQVRAHTEGHLGALDHNKGPALSKPPATSLDLLSVYFTPILWKQIKGNFILKTLADGTIDNVVVSDAFSDLKSPVVLGKNLLLSSRKKI